MNKPESNPAAFVADRRVDFEALFAASPNLYLVLSPELRIVAVNDAYCQATMTVREAIVGRHIFDVFPDNPDDPSTTGVANLRSSLERVLQFRRPDAMALQKYDILRPDSEGGGFTERYWSPLNTPVLDADGKVAWIIHRVEDVTALAQSQAQSESVAKLYRDQLGTIAQLREANRLLAAGNDENARLQKDLVARSLELQNEVAERRKTEEALKSTSEFHNRVIENIPAMVFVKDAKDHRFVYVNRAGEQLTGIERSNLLGKNDYDFFPKEQADYFVARDKEVLASGELQDTPEEEMTTPHNGVRLLHTMKLAVDDEQGNPKYLLALIEDITERKKAETALRESEIRLRGFLLASPDAVVIVDEGGSVLLASHRVESMFGYTSEEIVGQSINLLVPERHRDFHKLHLGEFTNRPDALMGTGRELSGRRKDGTEFPVEINLSPADTSTGLVVIAAIRNVSASKAMERQLHQAQKMEAIGNLTGGMAHDFNNLLSVIIGNLDLLRERRGTDPEADMLASEALEAALRGADLTQRLLAFARRQPLQPQRTDVDALVKRFVKLLRRTLVENVEISLESDEGLWPVVVDPSQLEASLLNIVNNARDAMPGGGMLTITAANRRLDEDYAALYPGLQPGSYVMIEIGDSGTGMSSEVLSQIFEPFFTTKEQGKGTGLGLSMVFGFAKQSGGHVNVYSEPGVGTTFRLYLPRAPVTGEERARERDAQTIPERGGHETILAVEDNPGLRRVVARQLKELGYRLIEAEDGPSALRALEANRVDLLFTDVVMPGGMSGYDLARKARELRPGLKVLLTSGFPEVKLNGNGAAPVHFRLLTKPYRRADLARTLREVIEGDS